MFKAKTAKIEVMSGENYVSDVVKKVNEWLKAAGEDIVVYDIQFRHSVAGNGRDFFYASIIFGDESGESIHVKQY